LQKRFNLQPFSKETAYTILLGLFAFFICYFLFTNFHGFAGMVIRSVCFIALYVSGTILLKLSVDVLPVWNTLLKKAGIKKGE
jgi:hypothetical protein